MEQQNVKNKPLCVLKTKATVIESPREKKIENDILYETYVFVNSEYRPFTANIYSKKHPGVEKGEEIEIELTTYQYKLRFAHKED